jgi:hypothetical protein
MGDGGGKDGVEENSGIKWRVEIQMEIGKHRSLGHQNLAPWDAPMLLQVLSSSVPVSQSAANPLPRSENHAHVTTAPSIDPIEILMPGRSGPRFGGSIPGDRGRRQSSIIRWQNTGRLEWR